MNQIIVTDPNALRSLVEEVIIKALRGSTSGPGNLGANSSESTGEVEYLTVAEYADKMRVSKQQVYHWVRTNQIQSKKIAGTVRIPSNEAR